MRFKRRSLGRPARAAGQPSGRIMPRWLSVSSCRGRRGVGCEHRGQGAHGSIPSPAQHQQQHSLMQAFEREQVFRGPTAHLESRQAPGAVERPQVRPAQGERRQRRQLARRQRRQRLPLPPAQLQRAQRGALQAAQRGAERVRKGSTGS